MLEKYYSDFKDVLERDINILLGEPDPTKRSNKQIKEFLEMLTDCQKNLAELENTLAEDTWGKLSHKAQGEILEIIKVDLNKPKHNLGSDI